MPSPFPGVDPYIEGQEWESFHGQLCAEIPRLLAPSLRPRYVALMERRLVFDTFEDVTIATRDVRPDVVVAAKQRAQFGSSALLEPPMRLAAPIQSEVPIHYVEIREVASMTVVTVIEILSPSNKRGEGREAYLRKRRSILQSDINLVELDLLRGGSRVPMHGTLPDTSYFAFIHRSRYRPMADVWPIGLREQLPTVPIPLLPPDKDAELDLQMAFAGAYDAADYCLALDHSLPLMPPLPDSDVAWAKSVVAGSSQTGRARTSQALD